MPKFYATLVYVAVLVISLTACGGTDEFSAGPPNSLNTAGAAGEPTAIPDAGGLGTGGSAPTAGASGNPSAGAAGDSGSPAGTTGKGTGGSAPSTGGSGTGGTATGGKSSTGGSGTGGSITSTGGSGTGGSTPSTGGSSPGTGGSGTGGLAPSTGGTGTGGSVPATGGQGTGGTITSTGGSGTGGSAPSTGGRGTGGTGTGGLTPSTGGTGTGGATPSTGGTGTGGTGTGGTPTCTADLNTDPHNCGSCGYACNIPTETCQAGTCTVLVCPSGTGNCDGNAQNGCETNTTTTDNCGACGVRCTAQAGMTATCSGTCQYACLPGFADCNGTLSDGCELAVSNDPANCGTCGHSCFGGTCTNGKCQFAVEELYRAPTLPAGTNPNSNYPTVNKIAVDSGSVYWTSWFYTTFTATTRVTGGKVQKTPKSGGSITDLATAGGYPSSLVVNNGFVYWVNPIFSQNTNHVINKTPVGGGSTIALATDTSRSSTLAVDGSYAYWLNSDDPVGYNAPAIVYSVPVGGGSVQTVWGPGDPAQVVASGDTGNLCFSLGAFSNTTSLQTVAFVCVGWTPSYNPYHFQGFPTGPQVEYYPSPLAVSGSHVYWGNELGTAREDRYSSSNIFLPGTTATAMIGDPTHLLWNGLATGFTSSAIFQVPVDGGTVRQLAPYSTDNITAMASDGSYVYWTNGTYIRRAPKL